MLAYERAAWTDEFQNQTSDPSHFDLPEVDGGMGKWRWAEGSEWHIEGAEDGIAQTKPEDDAGWIYYDNKWRDGRRGQDGWGRYTRRRKWIRDAELVDAAISPTVEKASSSKPSLEKRRKKVPPSSSDPAASESRLSLDLQGTDGTVATGADSATLSPNTKRRGWFVRSPRDPLKKDSITRARGNSSPSVSGSGDSTGSKAREEDSMTPVARLREREAEWGLGDDVSMALG